MINIPEQAWKCNDEKLFNELAPRNIREIRNNSNLKQYRKNNGKNEIDKMLKQEPTKKEIQKAIGKIKNNKAHGIDGIIGEAYKAAEIWNTDELHDLYKQIHNSDKVPNNWVEAALTFIYKNKGRKEETKNYRPIALLNISCKI